MDLLLNLVVVLASVLGASMAYPQARRVVTTRRFEGLSPVWAGVSIASNAWWLAYGAFADVWALVPVSIVSVALYGAIGVAMASELGRRAVVRLVAGAGVLALVPFPFLALGGWPLAGAAVGLCYGIQLVPAVVAAYSTGDLRGVAPGTWLIAWCEAGLWAVYSVAVRDPALAVGGVAGLTMSTMILVRLAATGHRPLATVTRSRLRVAR